MTAVRPAQRRTVVAALPESRLALWLAFVVVHFWLGFLNLNAPGLPLGDVTFNYQYWAQQADFSTYYVGIDSVWVYPIVALVPMVVAGIFGFQNYAAAWLSLIFVLDAIAFLVMVGWRHGGTSRRSTTIGWWWIAFLLLLGPIAMGRIDSVTIPLAIVAVLFLAVRPRLASVLLSIATWIKVWPAALIAAVLIASKTRVRVFIAAAVTSVLVVAAALALGSGANVFSFITQQTGRGLQVEAPISTVWMWLSFARVPGAFVYYDQDILTFQVAGPGADVAASVMSPILGVAILAIAALGILASRRGAPVTELLAPLSLALISGFIGFDKVGSPQYMTWLAVPVILGLATNGMGHGRSFRTPAIIVLVIGALTQMFYPYIYTSLLGLDPILLLVLTARNVLIFVLLVWSIGVLWQLSRPSLVHRQLAEDDAWLPTVWPFGERVDPWTVARADAEAEYGRPRTEPRSEPSNE
jgi:Glycosyltransferase family 87